MPDRRGGIGSTDPVGMGLPYSPSSRVISSFHACSDEQAFYLKPGVYYGEFKILPALFLPSASGTAIKRGGKQQIEALIQAFGGEANITQVDACITRLRVSVRHLAAVDSEALQQQGALGVIILGQQVHAIFGKQSDALRQLLDEHFAARK